MSEIVNFPTKEEPRIWVCACGCSSFELMSDNSVHCALCQTVSTDNGGWTAPDTKSEWDGDERVREISGNGDPEFAKRVVSRRALESDVTVIVVLKKDGAISAWTDVETAEQRDWVDRQLGRVKEIIETGRA
jgi:hypothetical protein